MVQQMISTVLMQLPKREGTFGLRPDQIEDV